MTNPKWQSIRNWPKGIRFYIAVATGLLTAEMYLWSRNVYGSSSTAAIRLEEVYAWTSVALILLTLSIGPLCALVPRLPGKAILRDARRLLGVSAAWFASWHVGISYFSQFHSANPLNLPSIYQKAFALGLIALIILLALAFTSFDAAFRGMGIWWFRLHRLIYLSGLLIMLHAFDIGVHAASWPSLISLTVAVGALFAAHLYLGFGRGGKPSTLRSMVLCYGLLLTVGVFVYGYTQHLGYSEVVGGQSRNGVQYEAR